MNLSSRVQSWFRSVLQRSRAEREMQAELRFHIETYAEDLIRSGVPGDQALRRARVEFGSLERAKEECRDASGANFFDSLLQDIRFGLRQLRKSPGFTAVAVLTLALGVGGTTAIFTLVYQVMLRSLPVAKPDQLWRVGDTVLCCYSDGYTQGNDHRGRERLESLLMGGVQALPRQYHGVRAPGGVPDR